jgi:hypothetical protein
MPATFHRVLNRYGTELLAASEADAATGRERLDLGDGPFSDEQVRGLIRDAADGRRGADDEVLQLLRHNFAVLAFAKHYLSVDSGAKTPEEDYLFHFLGVSEGKRILALAQGAARDTLCVNQDGLPAPAHEARPALATADAAAEIRKAVRELRAVALAEAKAGRPVSLPGEVDWRLTAPRQRPELDQRLQDLSERLPPRGVFRVEPEPAIWSMPVQEVAPTPASEWGLSADSPVVTGNLGMFYRDGKGRSQPYTWGEFMDHLARRVRAQDQPALVRAKYGVGFGLEGGDMPERAFDPDKDAEAAEFRHEIGGAVLLPEPLVLGPLDPRETRQYKERLAALVRRGEDQPLERLPPQALSALRHLGLLSEDVQETGASQPEVRAALSRFRALVGKAEPDDPEHRDRLMPAERIALEIYEQRLARYAALQAGQRAALDEALELGQLRAMPVGARKAAAPYISVLQNQLAERGLLKPPTRKVVWRDKKGKKHVQREPAPFVGFPGPATQAALDAFQWRKGLRKTQGGLDAVTLALLGLPPMGPEILRPMAGPYSAIDEGAADTTARCAVPSRRGPQRLTDLVPIWSRPFPRS